MDPNVDTQQEMRELRKISLEHTWKWFEFQANQRMVLFRFYLLFVSAIVAGVITLITKGYSWPIASLSFVGAFISILFWLIDNRIKFLLTVGFDALKADEEYIADITGNRKIILKDVATGQKVTVSKLFAALFLFNSTVFAAVAITYLFVAINAK